MIIHDHRFHVAKTGNVMNLYCVGDIHMGSSSFLQESYNALCDIAKKDKNAYFIFSGDITDDDRPSTRAMRRAMFNDRPEAFQQEDMQHLAWMDNVVIPNIKKLIRNKDRCLGVLDGDHFRVYSNGLSSVQYICAKLKIPYLGEGQAIVRLHFMYSVGQGRVIKIHTHHGKGGGVTEAADIRELQNLAAHWEDISIFIRGHSHKPKIFPYVKNKDLSTNPPSIAKIDRLLVNTGSFRGNVMMNNVDYAERRVYPPTSTRATIIAFQGKKINTYDISLRGILTEPL